MDVIIPFHFKDSDTLREVIPRLKVNIVNIKDIYIIGADNPNIHGTKFVSERIFPFKTLISIYYPKYVYRTGWIFQQLIKLTAWKYVSNLSDTYLVWDSDTVPYRRLEFFDTENHKFLFGKSYDMHSPYFRHIEKMIPCLTNHFLSFSGICHYQIFSTQVLKELFNMVQDLHSDMEFELVFLSMLDKEEKACCSEYELYANYMAFFHPEKTKFRDLKMISVATFDFHHTFDVNNPNTRDVDMISYHKYENVDLPR